MGNTTTWANDDDDDDDDDDVPFLFSEDVLIQILVWLPVISLLRFKSVCKSWRALIETPYFINLHTTTTFKSSSSSKFGSFILDAPKKMFMLSFKSSESVCGGGGGYEDIINKMISSVGYLPWNPMYSSYNMRMVGSCNGLICIQESWALEHEDAYLLNPATRQFRILPKPITIEEEEEKQGLKEVVNEFSDFVFFGFDIKTKDYKVVMFKAFRTPAYKYFCRIQVYNLSTDSWRLLEGMHYLPALPYNLPTQNQGIYINGCYLFVGKDEEIFWSGGKTIAYNNHVMYSFDFTKEILTTTQFPDHDSRHDLILTHFGADKIALFMIQRNSFKLRVGVDSGLNNEYYDIWVLNEQTGSNWVGVVNKESWTKVHSFQKINKLKYLSQPRCISNNGEFALISIRTPKTELQLFNLVTKEAVVIKEAVQNDFPVNYDIKRADVYTESLVSLGGPPASEIFQLTIN